MKHFYELKLSGLHLSYHSGYGYAKGRAMELSDGETMDKWQYINPTVQIASTKFGIFQVVRYDFSDPD